MIEEITIVLSLSQDYEINKFAIKDIAIKTATL